MPSTVAEAGQPDDETLHEQRIDVAQQPNHDHRQPGRGQQQRRPDAAPAGPEGTPWSAFACGVRLETVRPDAMPPHRTSADQDPAAVDTRA